MEMLVIHPAGSSVNSVNYELCSKFCLVHYNVSRWEFRFLIVSALLLFLSKMFFYENMHISPLIQATLPFFNF